MIVIVTMPTSFVNCRTPHLNVRQNTAIGGVLLFKHNALKLRENNMKQTQEMEQTLRAINPNAFLLFSLSKRWPLAPSWLKLGNWDDDLPAAQELRLKSGGGGQEGAASGGSTSPGDPSTCGGGAV